MVSLGMFFLCKNASPSFHLHPKMEMVSLMTTEPAHLGSEFVQCAGNENLTVINREQWDAPWLSVNGSLDGGTLPVCLFVWVSPSVAAWEDYADAFASPLTPQAWTMTLPAAVCIGRSLSPWHCQKRVMSGLVVPSCFCPGGGGSGRDRLGFERGQSRRPIGGHDAGYGDVAPQWYCPGDCQEHHCRTLTNRWLLDRSARLWIRCHCCTHPQTFICHTRPTIGHLHDEIPHQTRSYDILRRLSHFLSVIKSYEREAARIKAEEAKRPPSFDTCRHYRRQDRTTCAPLWWDTIRCWAGGPNWRIPWDRTFLWNWMRFYGKWWSRMKTGIRMRLRMSCHSMRWVSWKLAPFCKHTFPQTFICTVSIGNTLNL